MQNSQIHLTLGINRIFASVSFYGIEYLGNYNVDIVQNILAIEGGYKIPIGENLFLSVSLGFYTIQQQNDYPTPDITFNGVQFSLGFLYNPKPFVMGINYSYLSGIGITAGFLFPIYSN